MSTKRAVEHDHEDWMIQDTGKDGRRYCAACGVGVIRAVNRWGEPVWRSEEGVLSEVIVAFAEEYGTRLSTPEGAYDICHLVSDEFVSRCTEAGVVAQTISGLRYTTVEVGGETHTVVDTAHVGVLIGQQVYDWTIRQFDVLSAVPQVQPVHEWRRTWQPFPDGAKVVA